MITAEMRKAIGERAAVRADRSGKGLIALARAERQCSRNRRAARWRASKRAAISFRAMRGAHTFRIRVSVRYTCSIVRVSAAGARIGPPVRLSVSRDDCGRWREDSPDGALRGAGAGCDDDGAQAG